MRHFTLLFFIAFISTLSINAQSLQRIEADFSMKESDRIGNKKLTVGKVYYDKSERVVVFDIKFPYQEVLCLSDEGIFRFKADTLYSHVIAHGLIDFNIFSLFLSGDLDYYGLKNSPYNLVKVENDDGQVISTWEYPKAEEYGVGKMMLSQKDKLIFGIITFDKSNNIVGKQFFEEYISVKGFPFPTKVIQYRFYQNEKEVNVSTYHDVEVNVYEENPMYYYLAKHWNP